MFHHKAFLAAAAIALSGVAAQAATVLNIGTTGGAGSPFKSQQGGQTVVVSDPANAWILQDPNNGAPVQETDPASYWIWDAGLVNTIKGNTFGGPVTFDLTFSLAGFKASTAVLSGLIGLDDIGAVFLNGTKIFEDLIAYDGNKPNWAKLQTYGTSNGSLFLDGENTLSFFIENSGLYPAGLRATVLVEASPIPVPAALPLLAGALGAFGLVGMRRKRAKAA